MASVPPNGSAEIPRQHHPPRQHPPPAALQKPPGFRDPKSLSRPPPPLPRRPPLPQTFRQVGRKPPRRCSLRSVCCRLCCASLVFALFALALAGAVFYLYFQPRFPSFRVQSLRAPRFNVTDRSDGSGTFVDADVALRIFASNPNPRISLSYGPSEAAVYATGVDVDDVCLGWGPTGGFPLGTRNSTVMRFEAKGRGILVADAAGVKMRAGMRSGELRFRVEVRGKIEMGIAVGEKIKVRVPVRVDCPPASIKQLKGSGRNLLPKCDIYWFNRINLQ